MNGDAYTGITIHYIDENIDTGEIIIQKIVPIENTDYVADLQTKMLTLYKSIYIEALELVKYNTKQEGYFPNFMNGSYYGRLKPDNCLINLADGVINAYNKVRAVSFPYQGATFEDYKIWRAKIVSQDHPLFESVEIIELKEGIHLDSIFGPIIKFYDGILYLEKYSKL
jgi:methionyl-tRNA formyltransferase